MDAVTWWQWIILVAFGFCLVYIEILLDPDLRRRTTPEVTDEGWSIQLTENDIRECRRQAEAEVGLLIPEIERVQDGVYYRRVTVLPELLECRTFASLEEAMTVLPDAVATRVELCAEPRYRDRLVFRVPLTP